MSDMLVILQIIAVVVCLDIIVTLCFKKQCTERGTLLLIMVSVFAYNLVGALTGAMERSYIHEISDILYMMAEVCFFLGMWKLVGYLINRPWPRRLLNMVTVYFSILLIIRFTNDWHSLFYKKKFIQEVDGKACLQVEPGIGAYVYMWSIFLNIFLLFCVCLFVCIRRRKRTGRNEWMKYRLLVIATSIPCITSGLYFIKDNNYYKIEPVGMLIQSILILLVVNRYHFLQVVEHARNLVVETMDIGLIIVDLRYGYLNSNLYARKVLPELKQLERGQNIQTMIPKTKEFFESAIEGQLESENRCYAWKRSEVYLEKHQRGYSVCLYDITDSKKYMEQLVEMKRQAETENEQKSAFLANVSHEIRTPMNVIIGISEVYKQKTQDPELKSVLGMMQEAGERLLETINEILDFSKIEAGKAVVKETKYSLEKMLEAFYFMFQEKKNEKVEFKVEKDENVPHFLIGDSRKVQSVLMNLLSNAMKYTKEGSVILKVSVEEKEKEERIIFQVSDTGIGMEKEDAEHIFEKYIQVGEDTETNYKGTGLGLSITRSLVEMMKGTIQVETELGKGSTFIVSLPLVRAAEETGVQSFIYPESKALIVDDMETNLIVAKGMLGLYHIQTKGVSSGSQAIEAVKEENYDILLIDQMMPEMSGIETLQKIREMGCEVPAIALTAQSDEVAIHQLKNAGFEKVLIKPLERANLEQVLEIYLKDKQQYGMPQKTENEQDIYKSYYYQVSAMTEQLEKMYKKDFDGFLIQVHGIKSASRNIGAEQLGNLAEEIENEGKAGNREFVESHLAELIENLRETLQEVKKKIEKPQENKPQKEEIERKTLKYIAEKMEEFELEEAQKALEDLKEYSYPMREEAFLEELERMMLNLEYQGTVEEIHRFLSEG